MERVFVYGTLKKGFYNHCVLGDAKFIGNYITKPVYTMYDLGLYPAIGMTGSTAIIGEVYEVTDLAALDRLEGVPYFYNRAEIETEYGASWVYYIVDVDNLRYEIIEDGEWKLIDNALNLV